MPSLKKKARGKKAEKDEKKQLVACNGTEGVTATVTVAAQQLEGESLIQQIERMQLEDLMRQRLDAKVTCLHSLASLPDGYLLCGEFVDEFVSEVIAVGGCFLKAVEAVRIAMWEKFEAVRIAMWEKYAEIRNDAAKMQLAVSCLLLTGTVDIL
jgi:hypothetical protein